MTASAFPVPRLHIVTGKGGTGKTSVAAALALALAGSGRRVLLAEVEGRQGIAPLFEAPSLGYEERHLAAGLDGGEVFGQSVDADEALLDYLTMFYRLGSAGKALQKFGAIDFATTIAPGLRDILLTGKLKEAASRTESGRMAYDAVVLDAPPTGRVVKFLNVTVESGRLAKTGPIGKHSRSVARMLHSSLTAVHVVTTPAAMPVQETVDAYKELMAADLPVGQLVLNKVAGAKAVEVDAAQIMAGLERVGLNPDDAMVSGLVEEYTAARAEIESVDAYRDRLERLGRPVAELPLLPEGVDLSGLYQLARVLRPLIIGGRRNG
ncbi:ArsA-related P-loop ATPase [Glycomyces algeriensis]|uniref:ATPase n=1 Tax=Glycomyces algeriensis TaxID=256037 RepID=A0A9W6G701_9ACTN|nr:ArsA-related P-loop ATPase [Glycomyces algeriensis]MDA1368503.1 ATPase [Glycomyces algeriensis]MDR7348766.1 anion-transporting ArsA/GET3 family ATPase [Glycomyces algeriensis]GLI41469.1 ATPase [Glycomyces algeriensis]